MRGWLFTFTLLTTLISTAWAGQNLPGGGSLTSIDVTLFGQACKLEGPFPAKILEQIHAVSPAQIPLIRSEADADRALLILDSAPELPAALKSYRAKTLTYAKSRKQIAQAVQASVTAKKSDAALLAAKAVSQGKNLGEFRMRLELFLKKPTADNRDLMWESVDALLDPRPEPDFHRAIFRLKVNYQCEFGAEE